METIIAIVFFVGVVPFALGAAAVLARLPIAVVICVVALPILAIGCGALVKREFEEPNTQQINDYLVEAPATSTSASP